VRKTPNLVTEALGQAHKALLTDLQELEQAVLSSSGKCLAELRTRLAQAGAHIIEHFRFEEQDGYMAAVRKGEPRLERTVQELAEEHRQLKQTFDGLMKKTRAATSLDDALRAEIRGWIEHIHLHERRENDLVQDTFNLDIGAED
jgi:hypothetical protein